LCHIEPFFLKTNEIQDCYIKADTVEKLNSIKLSFPSLNAGKVIHLQITFNNKLLPYMCALQYFL
jgi:hypothetical protein